MAQPSKLLIEFDRVDAERSLAKFIKMAWHVLEPSRPYVHGWHIDAICEHLEAVTAGDITRLLINIPPGAMKSMSVNVFWPAWEWGPQYMPATRYVNASYSDRLSIRDNRKCRMLMASEWYQERWGRVFRMSSDQNEKVKYENNKTGFRLATSVGGLGTGERGDRFIIDDPHNVKKGESEADRLEKELWFTESVPTRMNDPEKSAIVVIMQRVHERDISGLILENDYGYEHLMIPMEFEEKRRCTTSIGWIDPREKEGELMFPGRFPDKVVRRDKKVMGTYAVAGQFQQRPAPRDGGLFKRTWFGIIPAAPAGIQWCRGWDLAGTESSLGSDPDYTAGVLMGSDSDGCFYIAHVERFRATPAVVERTIKNVADQDRAAYGRVKISLPQDPGQAGKSQKQYLGKTLAGHVVTFSPETGSKFVRAEPFATQAEAGNVYLVAGDDSSWIKPFLDETCMFPGGSHDDQVDGASRAFNELLNEKFSYIGMRA